MYWEVKFSEILKRNETIIRDVPIRLPRKEKRTRWNGAQRDWDKWGSWEVLCENFWRNHWPLHEKTSIKVKIQSLLDSRWSIASIDLERTFQMIAYWYPSEWGWWEGSVCRFLGNKRTPPNASNETNKHQTHYIHEGQVIEDWVRWGSWDWRGKVPRTQVHSGLRMMGGNDNGDLKVQVRKIREGR